MEVLERSNRAGRSAECVLESRILDLESLAITVVRRATLIRWLGRLAYGGMLGLLFALGLGVVAAHSGMR